MSRRPFFAWCSRGVTRRVILVGEYAIKIPTFTSWFMFLQGLGANLTERRLWRAWKHEMLCPVLFSDPIGLFVVMPRADEVLTVKTAFVLRFFERASSQGLPVDPNPHNIGVFQSRFKLIDYGS